MNIIDYGLVEDRIGYVFKNKWLLRQAFIRRSYSQEQGGESNEVLEYYGDIALELIVGKLFSEQFGYFENDYNCSAPSLPITWGPQRSTPTSPKREYRSDYDEGQLTEFRKALVSRQTLAQKIYDMDFERFLLLGKSDENNDVRNKDSVREDLFEAILGAVAIDCGWDIKKLQNVVEVMLDTKEFFSDDNYVDDITEWTINEYDCVPDFQYFSTYFPKDLYFNSIHINISNQSNCYIKLGDYEHTFIAGGKTQGEAKYNVCKAAYEHLRDQDLLNLIKFEIETPNEQMAINQLEILSRRGYFDLPKYKYTETHDKDGNPIWQVTCMINGFDKVFNATSTSKKAAKKKAAFKMLNYILENYDEED